MNLFVGVTDHNWYQQLSAKPDLEELNFWRPSPTAGFKALRAGELFLFKLHAPRNVIVGGGLFASFVHLPISQAWEVFGEANGVQSPAEMRARIANYRRGGIGPFDDPQIGCILLQQPFFFTLEAAIPVPASFKLNIVQGKGYDAGSGDG